MNSKENHIYGLVGKIVLLSTIIYFSHTLLASPNPWILLDAANLAIHEAGHLLFIFFGDTVQFLAGTLIQLFIPFLFLLYFIYKRSVAGTGFCLFWIGDNLINIGWYMKDARTMQIPLVGGGIHDWNWLFTKWGVLAYDQQIGSAIHTLGAIFITVSILFLTTFIIRDAKQLVHKNGNLIVR